MKSTKTPQLSAHKQLECSGKCLLRSLVPVMWLHEMSTHVSAEASHCWAKRCNSLLASNEIDGMFKSGKVPLMSLGKEFIENPFS